MAKKVETKVDKVDGGGFSEHQELHMNKVSSPTHVPPSAMNQMVMSMTGKNKGKGGRPQLFVGELQQEVQDNVSDNSPQKKYPGGFKPLNASVQTNEKSMVNATMSIALNSN